MISQSANALSAGKRGKARESAGKRGKAWESARKVRRGQRCRVNHGHTPSDPLRLSLLEKKKHSLLREFEIRRY